MSANSERERYEAWLEADGRCTTIWDVWQAALSSPHTPPAVEPVALTDARIMEIWMSGHGTNNGIIWFGHAILAAAQEVEFTDDPVSTYKPGPPLEWEEGGA